MSIFFAWKYSENLYLVVHTLYTNNIINSERERIEILYKKEEESEMDGKEIQIFVGFHKADFVNKWTADR